MAEKIQFELVSPERLLMSKPVDMVVVPGSDGNFGALPRHAPLISTIRPGVIDVYDGGSVHDQIFVVGGFAEVDEEHCVVLADEAIMMTALDELMAKQRMDEAERLLYEATDDKQRKAAERMKAVADAMYLALRDNSSHVH